MIQILSVEDSVEIQMLIKKSFPVGNFIISLVDNLAQAKSILESNKFDTILLDIDLPDGDGLKFYAELKNDVRFSEIPVFILTGKNNIQDKSLGFQLGIEDFITKPFDPAELKLRVESRLKKILQKVENDTLIQTGNLLINLNSQRVTIINGGEEFKADLSATEFKILAYLAKHKEQIKSRNQIMTAVWGDSATYSDRTIDSHISRLRKKIIGCDFELESVANSGYRFSRK